MCCKPRVSNSLVIPSEPITYIFFEKFKFFKYSAITREGDNVSPYNIYKKERKNIYTYMYVCTARKLLLKYSKSVKNDSITYN